MNKKSGENLLTEATPLSGRDPYNDVQDLERAPPYSVSDLVTYLPAGFTSVTIMSKLFSKNICLVRNMRTAHNGFQVRVLWLYADAALLSRSNSQNATAAQALYEDMLWYHTTSFRKL